MKKTAHHFWVIFMIGLLIPCSAFSDVFVYGEGTITEDQLNVSLYADITSPTELRSAGVTLTYDPAEMIVSGAEKNGFLWSIDDSPYMDPDTDKAGQVIVLTFKLDALEPSAGVNGEKVLLGTVTFIPPAQGTPHVDPRPRVSWDSGPGLVGDPEKGLSIVGQGIAH